MYRGVHYYLHKHIQKFLIYEVLENIQSVHKKQFKLQPIFLTFTILYFWMCY